MYPFSRIALAITPSPARADACLAPKEASGILQHLLECGCIMPDAEIRLQHDGDPLEHPAFSAMLRLLGGMGFGYHITTKARTVPVLDKDLRLEHLRSLTFTMDGYCDIASGADCCGSLAAMHDCVLTILRRFRAQGFRGRTVMMLPPYPMEEERDEAVCAFAFTAGMAVLRPVTPPMSVEDACAALSDGNSCAASTPAAAPAGEHSHKALLPPFWRLLRSSVAQLPPRPENFHCVVFNELAISVTGQLLPCAQMLHPEHALGDIRTMTLEDIARLRGASEPCRLCRDLGADWALSTVPAASLPPRIAGMPERLPFLTPGGRWVWVEDNPFGDSVRQDNCAPRLRHFCRASLRSGHIGLDVGAKSGYYTTLFARLVGAEGKVYAFEPDARLQRVLEHAVHANGLHNTMIMPCGAGGLPLDDTVPAPESKALRPLDAMSARLVLPHLDFLRIDAGRDTPAVLAGALQLINRSHPLIMLAFDPEAWARGGVSPERLLAWVKAQGLRCFTTTGQEIPDTNFSALCADPARGSHLLLRHGPLA